MNTIKQGLADRLNMGIKEWKVWFLGVCHVHLPREYVINWDEKELGKKGIFTALESKFSLGHVNFINLLDIKGEPLAQRRLAMANDIAYQGNTS